MSGVSENDREMGLRASHVVTENEKFRESKGQYIPQ